MSMSVCHDDGSKDSRYTIRREWTGKDQPQWVVRFCGRYLGVGATVWVALAVGRRHQEGRQAVLEGRAT